MYSNTHIYIYIYIYMYVHIYAYTYVYMYMYVCVCVCVCVFIYVYIYICACQQGRKVLQVVSHTSIFARFLFKNSPIMSAELLRKTTKVFYKSGLLAKTQIGTGWRRYTACLMLQVFPCKRVTKHRALMQKMTGKDRHPMHLRHPVRTHLHLFGFFYRRVLLL